MNEDEEEIHVYFVSANEKRIYKAVAQDVSIENLKQTYYARAERYTPFYRTT